MITLFSGCDPTIMGIGPVPAIRGLLGKADMKIDDIDQVEINEAFGAQALSCQKELGIDMNKFNTCGGAFALMTPLGSIRCPYFRPFGPQIAPK